ncbi:MAG: tetratricopeptide repeat protein [Phycisphaeraceae bacterium]
MTLLAAIFVILAGGVYGLYVLNSARQVMTDQEIVAEAKEAFEAEDFARVIELLEQPGRAGVIPAIHNDPVLIQHYLTARLAQPMPGDQHLLRLEPALTRLVNLEPDNREKQLELLDLLLTIGKDRRALDAAERFANAAPDDAELARYLGSALLRNNKEDRALIALGRSIEIEPLNVTAQATILELLQDSDKATEPFVKQARAVYDQHPDDPRALMVQALGYRAEGNNIQAREYLKRAAEHEPIDDRMTTLLVQWLDRNELAPLATRYLLEHAPVGVDTFAGELAVYRAFETGNHRAIAERLADADPRRINPDLLGMWADAHRRLSDIARARELTNQLKRRDTAVADGWADILSLDLDSEATPANIIDTIIARFEDAGDRPTGPALRRHPYLLQRLGEAYLAVEEPRAGVTVLSLAASNNRSWARPHRVLAEALLKQNQPQDALGHAENAHEREPTPATQRLVALATLAAADPADQLTVEKALHHAERFAEAHPNDRSLVPSVVALLARAGQRQQAIATIQTQLASPASLSAEQFAELINRSRQHSLGLAGALTKALTERYPDTPEAIAAQATALALEGDAAAGRQRIEDKMPSPTPAAWHFALGNYLFNHLPDQAADYLRGVADARPEAIEFQLAALYAPGGRSDRDFVDRAIQRLRTFAGESTVNWRLEAARLHLADEPNADDLNQAIALLERAQVFSPAQLQTQTMLTRCRLLQDDPAAALEHAQIAKLLAPRDPGVMMLHGETLHRLSRYQDARADLFNIAKNATLAVPMRLKACRMLKAQGERAVVRDAIESMRKQGRATTPALLMLAEVYATTGELKKIDALCLEMLREPSAEALGFVASFYRETGRQELSDHLLANVPPAVISKADRLMLVAEDAADRGDAPSAIAAIEQAAEQQPDDVDRWLEAVAMAVSLNLADEAVRLAERGLAAHPEVAGLDALFKHRAIVKRSIEDPRLAPLVSSILTDASHRETAIQALTLADTEQDPASVANRIAELSQASPSFKPLAELAGKLLLAAKAYDRAYAASSSVMARFPDSADAAMVATLAAYQLDDWPALLSAANAWLERNPRDSYQADLMRAAAQVELRRYSVAANTLAPYRSDLADGPEADGLYFELYTKALVHAGQSDEAWTLLIPHLAKSETTRAIALRRIANDLANADAAVRWLNETAKHIGDDAAALFSNTMAAFMAGQRLDSDALNDTAWRLIRRVTAMPGPHAVDVQYVFGQIALQQGDLASAEKSFRAVRKAAPQNPLVLNNLALVLAEQDGSSLTEAEALAERAVSLSDEDPNLYDTLAVVRLKLNRLDEALEAIDHAIRLDPNNAAWQLTLADILDAKGEADRAKRIRQQHGQRVSH